MALLIAVVVLAVALVAVGMWALGRNSARPAATNETPVVAPTGTTTEESGTEGEDVTATEESDEVTTVETEPTPEEAVVEETEPAPAPVPAEDPVAEATVVLENYLAADLGHDGNEMKKYLAGSAGARFRPEVQGQEDVVTHSLKVSGHTVKDANTIVFKVAVRWSMSDSDEVKTQSDRYVVKRTTKGWKITSTPAYP
jgi:hypothetical protein